MRNLYMELAVVLSPGPLADLLAYRSRDLARVLSLMAKPGLLAWAARLEVEEIITRLRSREDVALILDAMRHVDLTPHLPALRALAGSQDELRALWLAKPRPRPVGRPRASVEVERPKLARKPGKAQAREALATQLSGTVRGREVWNRVHGYLWQLERMAPDVDPLERMDLVERVKALELMPLDAVALLVESRAHAAARSSQGS